MRAPTDGTGTVGAAAGGAGVGPFSPTLLAWALLAVGLVLTGSRWPTFAYGTLALALLYLLVVNGEQVGQLGARLAPNLSQPFSR